MKIEHIAIWVNDLEEMRAFYERYFQVKASDLYTNPAKNFSSYFLNFKEGSRLELMHNREFSKIREVQLFELGYAHIAISVGDKSTVNTITEQFRSDGFTIVGEPRTTGDGYYESVILDPEKNRIEITI
ncbi:VOC family protein [Saprospiraceae bacterium]|nr:VOC family protein [Saprospiraceae bacterium]